MSLQRDETARLTPFEVMLDQSQIARRIVELGRLISRDYARQTPVLVGVLKGSMVFLADLMRAIKLPVEVDFVSASSYRQGTAREEKVVVDRPIAMPLKGRHVLLVEGVVDTGHTVTAILKQIRKQEPASAEVVTLIDKPSSHRTVLDIKYKGFSIGNEFVIGFGLDNAQKYRNLPFIGRVIDQ
ncbi:MAG TPA: hypoxanthine phosphoribosyltransferase [Candidatus Deferrimicrobium sp.]|nr:hypoxanthine phosphoribosyltransferase [Candidatus Deferrimicrobium sp.]